jgi:hypothetical protein
MNKLSYLYPAFLIFLSILVFSFKSEDKLILDQNNSIQLLVENEGTSDAYIQTLKLSYKDLNVKVKTKPTDSTYYRCAYETRLTFYSAFDSLEINSISRKSCDINAYFNLNEVYYKWLRVHPIYYVKIRNMNTKYEIIHDLPTQDKQRYIQIKLYHYNRIK